MRDNVSDKTDSNYRSVWARDGAMTVLYTLELESDDIKKCQYDTLNTLLDHITPNGQVPANVRIDDEVPDYGGVGGIGSIDNGLWLIIAIWRLVDRYQDHQFLHPRREQLQRIMDWLSAQDVNNCGLLEITESGDWMDLFNRSYNVLYDEVLWYRALVCYSSITKTLGEDQKSEDYIKWAHHVKETILNNFWPSTTGERGAGSREFSQKQFSLGNSQYLISQISPFSFSWRCDVYANILAFLNGVTKKEQAMMTFRFLWGVGANRPWPIQNIYPPVYSGDPEWKEFFIVNLLNLPYHYHNGGIWPFIGSLWVRFIHKLGMANIAVNELIQLAKVNKMGFEREWEFNEWVHGVTGQPMGKCYQAWSAAGFVQACHDLQCDPEHIPEAM